MSNDITATFVISGKKNAPKTNPAKMVITVMKGDCKAADINLVYINKHWHAASGQDSYDFFACVSNGAPVSRLEKYINAAWDFASTCNKESGINRSRKWDIVNKNL